MSSCSNNPRPLYDLARYKINSQLDKKQDTKKLPLPKPIQKDVKKQYVYDLLYCNETMGDLWSTCEYYNEIKHISIICEFENISIVYTLILKHVFVF